MSLQYEKPNVALKRRLDAVATRAQILSDIVRGENMLPDNFPKEQLKSYLEALTTLPYGTAEGCRVSLELMRNELPRISRENIYDAETLKEKYANLIGNDLPPLQSEGMLDTGLDLLISAVTKAYDEYRRQAAEVVEEPIINEETRAIPLEVDSQPVLLLTNQVDEALKKDYQEADAALPKDNIVADNFKRSLKDAQSASLLARGFLQGKHIVRRWFRKSVEGVKRSSSSIRVAGNILKKSGIPIAGVTLLAEISIPATALTVVLVSQLGDRLGELANYLDDNEVKNSHSKEFKSKVMYPIRIAVIGKTGQLARGLEACLNSVDDIDAKFYGRDVLDLRSDAQTITDFIEKLSVDAIIIAAAYTAVDKAETDRQTAFAVNALAPAVIAKACAKKNTALVHVSTDYVFSGTGNMPFSTDTPVQPLGGYGSSKASGEAAVLAAHPKAAIVRTSWVFDGSGANFFNTMLRVGAARESLTVVSDQLGRPTYAGHLARAMMDMLPALIGGTASGLYHVTGTGDVISWADFARTIFDISAGHRDHKVTVTDISSSDYPTPAARPAYSALDTSKYESQFGALPDWQSGLKEAYKEWALANA